MSYTGGSVATCKLSHAGGVKGDDPNEKRYRSPPGCGLGLKLTKFYVQKPLKMPGMGLINTRLSGYKGEDLIGGTWNVRTLFEIGELFYLSSLLKKYRRKPRTRWEDVVQRDASQILGIREWIRRVKDRREWRRLLREARSIRRCR